MTAFDVFKKLDEINNQSLTPLQRVLLITDGTLTEILEAHFLERIQLIKLSQKLVTAAPSHARFKPNGEESFLERKILLRGSNSGRTYVYAESVIAVERLGSHFREELLNSDIPLGRLWLDHKLETYKELIGVECQPANELHHHFGSAVSSLLLSRTYGVTTNAKLAMVITEHFPAEKTLFNIEI